jgi:hypothetical protein
LKEIEKFDGVALRSKAILPKGHMFWRIDCVAFIRISEKRRYFAEKIEHFHGARELLKYSKPEMICRSAEEQHSGIYFNFLSTKINSSG